jgi:hypothetical protein
VTPPGPVRDAAPAPTGEREPAVELTALVRELVDALAPPLGLAPAQIRVHAGEPGRRALAFGARGLVERGEVFLAPGAVAAPDAAARSLLAHELAHLAQQRRTAAPAGLAAGADPEAEARALAEAAATGLPLWRPLAALAPDAAAADTGSVGTLPRPAGPAAKPAQTPSAAKPATDDEERNLELLNGRLIQLVERRYAVVRGELRRRLNGLWVDSDDARRCLQLIDPIPFVIARAIVASLPAGNRLDLGTTIETSHHRSFPRSAVAALAAMAPIQQSSLQASNVEGLDTRDFDDLATRAAIGVLRGLRQAVLAELLDGDRKDFFRELLTGADFLFGTEGHERAAIVNALRDEAERGREEKRLGAESELKETLRKLRGRLRKPSAEDAVAALDLLKSLAPAAVAAVPVTAGAGAVAPPKPDLRPDPPDPGPRLRQAVRTLEYEGAIVRLLNALPEDERRAGSRHAGALLTVLAARQPQLNLALAEKLLSYSFFGLDWVITDAEARFAYLLVRSLPLELQDRWKRLDEGKWFQRLEENIPHEDIVEGRYAGVGTRSDPFDQAAGDTVRKDADKAVKDIDAAISSTGTAGAKSVELLRRILALGRRPGITSPLAAGPDRWRLMENVVRRLDALGHIDRILDDLPDAYLMNEQWRSELLEVLAVRDPRHLERHARRLLSYHLLDWAVTAREAWLAFQLVRNLSPEDQTRLKAEDPDRWDRIQSEMTDAMRASTAVTQVAGRTAFESRDRLRDRLRAQEIWSKKRKTELRSLIIQLYALDDRRWVWLRSRDVRADKIDGLQGLVADLKLYDAVKNADFSPEQLRSTPLGEEGVFQLLAEYARLIAVGAELLWLARSSLITDTIEVRDFDLADLASALGGDLSGARLADRNAVRARDEAGGKRPAGPDANRAGFTVNPREGIITLDLPRLELDGFNRAFAGTSLRTGRISLRGVTITASFSDRGYERPVGAIADFKETEVNDAVVANDGIPGGLLAAARLGLSTLHFRSGATGTETRTSLTRPGSHKWIAIPVLEPFMHVLSHIVSFSGTIPGLTSIPGMLVGPATAGAPFLAREAVSTGFDETLGPVAEGFLGLVTDGVFRKPRTVTERAQDAIAMMRSFELSVGSLRFDGLSLAGIEQVGSVEVKNLVLGLGFSRPTVLRAEKRSVQRRLKDPVTQPAERAELAKRKQAIENELAELEPLEKELDKLEARYRWDHAALSDAEQAKLRRLSDRLRQTAGAVVDVGSIAVEGLSGRVESAGFDLRDIHGASSVPTRIGEYLPNDELVRRFQRERKPPSLAETAKRLEGGVTVGSVTFHRAADGGPVLRILPGRLPTPAEVWTQIRTLGTDPRYARLARDLVAWVPKLLRIEELAALADEPVDLDRNYVKPTKEELEPRVVEGRKETAAEVRERVGRRRPRRADEEAELQELRADALRFFATSVETLEASGIAARLDPATLGARIEIGHAEATGIRRGATRIASITGEHVELAASLAAGEEGGTLPAELARAAEEEGLAGLRPGVSVGAGKLAVKGLEQPGLAAEAVTVNGLSGRLVPDGYDLRLRNLVVGSAELAGVSYEAAGRHLYTTGTTRTGRITGSILAKTRPDPADPSSRALDELVVEHLRIERLDADRLGMEVTQPAPGYSVEATSGALIGITLDDLHLDFSGQERPPTGTIGVDRFEQLRFAVVTRALKGGPTTLTGTLAGTSAAGPQARALRVELLRTGAREIDLTSTELLDADLAVPGGGALTIKRAGLSGHVTQQPDGSVEFDHVGPLRVEVSAIDWHTAGGAQITAHGSSVLDGVAAAGSWKAENDRLDDQGNLVPGRKELRLQELRIARVTSNDLHYRDGVIDVHLGRDDTRRADLLDIHDVLVRDLTWISGVGVTEGTVRTGKTRAEVGGRVAGTRPAAKPGSPLAVGEEIKDALYLRAAVAATGIELSFQQQGRLVARVRGGEGDIGIGATKEASDLHAKFKDLDTGVVEIRPDSIEIGPEGTDGLHLPQLTLDQVDWNWAGTTGLGFKIPFGAGSATLSDIRARVRVELHPAGHKGGGRFKRMIIRQLSVGHMQATGLHIRISDADLSLGTDQLASLGALELTPRSGEELFVVEPKASGAGFNVSGHLGLGAISLPKVQADIGSTLSASATVAAARLDVDFLGVHGISLSLKNPSITNIKAYLEGDSKLPKGDHIHLVEFLPAKGELGLKQYGLRAEEIVYKRETDDEGKVVGETVTVKGAGFDGLEYSNSAAGIHLYVHDGRATGDLTHDLVSGAGKVPGLEINDAVFDIDLITLLGADKSSAADVSTGDKAADMLGAWQDLARSLKPYKEVLGSLNGTLDFDLVTTDTTFPIRATFKDGAFDYQRLGKALFPNVPWVHLYFEQDGNTLLLRARPKVTLLKWDLSAGEVTRAKKEHLLAIDTALHPDYDSQLLFLKILSDVTSDEPGRLSLANISADLSIENDTEKTLSLPGGNEIVLAPNAIAHLKAAGQIKGRTAEGSAQTSSLEAVSLERATVARSKLAFGATELGTGRIELTKIDGVKIDFLGLSPVSLSGHITKATASEITWKRRGKGTPK